MADRQARRTRNRRVNKVILKILAIPVALFALLFFVADVAIATGLDRDPGTSRWSGIVGLVFWVLIAWGVYLLIRRHQRRKRRDALSQDEVEEAKSQPGPPIRIPPPAPPMPDPSTGSGSPTSVPRRRLDRLPAHYPRDAQRIRLCADGRMQVVGESFYQPALEAVARGVVVPQGALHLAIPVEVALVPDPRNPHDSNAVRVEIENRHVGHLSRYDAPYYQPVLLGLASKRLLGTCPGRIMGGGPGRFYGVHLHLSSPELLLAANQPDGADVWEAQHRVTVTGADAHQDVLRSLGPAQEISGGFPAFATLAACTIAKGKYAGDRTVEVLIEGNRVGQLTKTMADRYLPAFDADVADGRRPGCQVYVQDEWSKGMTVVAMLPRADALTRR